MKVFMDMVYDTAHLVFFLLFRLLFRFRVIGHENVPVRGPVIIACNHASYLDPALVGTAMWRRVNFMAKEELFVGPAQGFFLRCWRSFPISRERLDKKALKEILDKLKSGEALGVFPEGTRSPDGELMDGKAGVGLIVSLSKAPVVPVYIHGSYRSLGKLHKKLRPVPISITFGRPIDFQADADGRSGERHQAIADTIMEEIARLKSGAA